MKISAQLTPMAIGAVVLLMVIPLPHAALDFLIALNIGLSLSLLLSSASIKRPETFTILPAVLLVSTLFRLGLNIATTRQILSMGEAPETVRAFGEFVVGGNLVVGAVVFLIITVVQFLVISKGAERVAEVAARFTLDAMPGKQISIDADLRSGVISLAEARERRLDLQSESRLYGALDGAMKFIKGDAVAGLLITVLNIIAGMIIGTTYHALPFGEAAKRFTLYTIGDGLSAQIPALLVSFAAGLAVTRVSGRETGTIGGDLVRQLTEERGVPLLTCGSLLFVACLPGTPALPFLGSALLAGSFALVSRKSKGEDVVPFRPRGASPLALHLSHDALRALQREGNFVAGVQEFRRSSYADWGVILPEPEVQIESEWQGIMIEFRRFHVPFLSLSGAVPEGLSEHVLAELRRVGFQRLHEFLDDTQTRLLFEANEGVCEDLINSVIPSILSVTAFTRLLRQLLEEGLSLSEFPSVLQGVLEWHVEGEIPNHLKSLLLLANVRRQLKRTIQRQVEGRKAIELGDGLELELTEEILEKGFISDHERRSQEIRSRMKELDAGVLLTSELARRAVWELFRDEEIQVVSKREVEGILPILGAVREESLRLVA